jgi:hypothetical protein
MPYLAYSFWILFRQFHTYRAHLIGSASRPAPGWSAKRPNQSVPVAISSVMTWPHHEICFHVAPMLGTCVGSFTSTVPYVRVILARGF